MANWEFVQGLLSGIFTAFGYGIAGFETLRFLDIQIFHDTTKTEPSIELLIMGLVIGTFGLLIYFKKSKKEEESENEDQNE